MENTARNHLAGIGGVIARVGSARNQQSPQSCRPGEIMNKLNPTFLRQFDELGTTDCAINRVNLETTTRSAVKKKETAGERVREKSRRNAIRDQCFRSRNIVRNGRSPIVQMQRVIGTLDLEEPLDE